MHVPMLQANDMQFYVASPLFILLYLRGARAGAAAVVAVAALSTVGMAVGTALLQWSALTLDGKWTVDYSEQTYTMPWFRCLPYLVGMR
jgi:peptidoglycan/LPS O-acetylase OafA/YrhL